MKHAACHWLVNFALELAQLVEPDRKWRIITSDKHSTVWDGGDMRIVIWPPKLSSTITCARACDLACADFGRDLRGPARFFLFASLVCRDARGRDGSIRQELAAGMRWTGRTACARSVLFCSVSQ